MMTDRRITLLAVLVWAALGVVLTAVETEALGQANIVAALRARLDELMPEPLADVLERQDQQRARVAAELRRFTRRTQT